MHGSSLPPFSRFYKLHERKCEPIVMTVPRKVRPPSSPVLPGSVWAPTPFSSRQAMWGEACWVWVQSVGWTNHQGVRRCWAVLGRGQAEIRVRAKARLWMNHRRQPGGLLVGGGCSVAGAGPSMVGSRPGPGHRAGNGEGQGGWLQWRPPGGGDQATGGCVSDAQPRALGVSPPSPASIC